MKHLIKHFRYYLILAIMQLACFSLLISLSGRRNLQIAVIFTSTISYVAWAIIHHYREHSLNKKIVLEYVLFGIFGIVSSMLYFQ